jgi:hypothetical protein
VSRTSIKITKKCWPTTSSISSAFAPGRNSIASKSVDCSRRWRKSDSLRKADGAHLGRSARHASGC